MKPFLCKYLLHPTSYFSLLGSLLHFEIFDSSILQLGFLLTLCATWMMDELGM